MGKLPLKFRFKKGDIVSVNFPFTDGSGIKVRPALVLSGAAIHKKGDVILVQITSKVINDGLSIALNNTDLIVPLPLKSYVRVYKIFVTDKSLLKAKISSLHTMKHQEIVNAIKLLL